jgi:prepilin-type N-terminal cleavage/methylation domain-containing protein
LVNWPKCLGHPFKLAKEWFWGKEKGVTLIETLVALALLGIIGVGFLSGLSTVSKALSITDEQATAKNLAESQMEILKRESYDLLYTPAPIPSEYVGYSAEIDTELLRDSNIQKIAVIIKHNGEEVTTLEGYKVNR